MFAVPKFFFLFFSSAFPSPDFLFSYVFTYPTQVAYFSLPAILGIIAYVFLRFLAVLRLLIRVKKNAIYGYRLQYSFFYLGYGGLVALYKFACVAVGLIADWVIYGLHL